MMKLGRSRCVTSGSSSKLLAGVLVPFGAIFEAIGAPMHSHFLQGFGVGLMLVGAGALASVRSSKSADRG